MYQCKNIKFQQHNNKFNRNQFNLQTFRSRIKINKKSNKDPTIHNNLTERFQKETKLELKTLNLMKALAKILTNFNSLYKIQLK